MRLAYCCHLFLLSALIVAIRGTDGIETVGNGNSVVSTFATSNNNGGGINYGANVGGGNTNDPNSAFSTYYGSVFVNGAGCVYQVCPTSI